MFWTALIRAGMIFSTLVGAKQVYEWITRVEISPIRLYTQQEVANILGVDLREVEDLVEKKQLAAKPVAGRYRIPGQSILTFLNSVE